GQPALAKDRQRHLTGLPRRTRSRAANFNRWLARPPIAHGLLRRTCDEERLGAGITPPPSIPLDRRRRARQLRRRRPRSSSIAAKQKSKRLALLRVDAARTHAPGAMGHSGIQPQPETRVSALAIGLLAEIGGPALGVGMGQECESLSPRSACHGSS